MKSIQENTFPLIKQSGGKNNVQFASLKVKIPSKLNKSFLVFRFWVRNQSNSIIWTLQTVQNSRTI